MNAAAGARSLRFFVPCMRGRDGRPRPHPGTNELVNTAMRNRFAYASLKREYTEHAMGYALEAASRQGWRAPSGRVAVSCTWVERDRRRDPDNVEGGVKWLLDGIVRAGALKDDSQRYVASVSHSYTVGKHSPGVYVTLEAVDER